jgi:hypothetical protein
MNIQKEREAFEDKFPVPAHWIDFDGLTCKYICKYNAIDYQALKYQARWEAWQAAKAQAVLEWISVEDQMPPVDETILVCWDYAPDIEPEKEYTTIDENLDEYWPNCQDEPPTHWMSLPKVIKAQEPAND